MAVRVETPPQTTPRELVCTDCGLVFAETPKSDHDKHGACPRCASTDTQLSGS
jgi:uncharacterized paraquat-inducible protein A